MHPMFSVAQSYNVLIPRLCYRGVSATTTVGLMCLSVIDKLCACDLEPTCITTQWCLGTSNCCAPEGNITVYALNNAIQQVTDLILQRKASHLQEPEHKHRLSRWTDFDVIKRLVVDAAVQFYLRKRVRSQHPHHEETKSSLIESEGGLCNQS